MTKQEILLVLAALVVYCHHHEGWQDDHPRARDDAERLLSEAGVPWEEMLK